MQKQQKKQAIHAALVGLVVVGMSMVWQALYTPMSGQALLRIGSNSCTIGGIVLWMATLFRWLGGLGLLFPLDTPDFAARRHIGLKGTAQKRPLRDSLPMALVGAGYLMLSVVLAVIYSFVH